MQFVESCASSASISYNSRPTYSSPLSYYSSTFSDPPSSPPTLASSSSASSGMSSSSPFRHGVDSSYSVESDHFHRRRQSYRSTVSSRRSRPPSSTSPSPQERFRRQTVVRTQVDRAKIVNNKRNGCGKDAIRTGSETEEELAVLRKMWMGDTRERGLQADPELNQMREKGEIQDQDDTAVAGLDVIYEEDGTLGIAEYYEEMCKDASTSYERSPGDGLPEHATHHDGHIDFTTDMDMEIEDYLDDDSIFEAALEQSETTYAELSRPDTNHDSNSMDIQE